MHPVPRPAGDPITARKAEHKPPLTPA